MKREINAKKIEGSKIIKYFFREIYPSSLGKIKEKISSGETIKDAPTKAIFAPTNPKYISFDSVNSKDPDDQIADVKVINKKV